MVLKPNNRSPIAIDIKINLILIFDNLSLKDENNLLITK